MKKHWQIDSLEGEEFTSITEINRAIDKVFSDKIMDISNRNNKVDMSKITLEYNADQKAKLVKEKRSQNRIDEYNSRNPNNPFNMKLVTDMLEIVDATSLRKAHQAIRKANIEKLHKRKIFK